MKTRNQISRKKTKLKRRLISMARQKGIWENFGNKEMQELDEFIGDKYQYPYELRLWIETLVSDFFNWCINYHI